LVFYAFYAASLAGDLTISEKTSVAISKDGEIFFYSPHVKDLINEFIQYVLVH
jgi:hypothetical protein